jgi:hypothetical protein
MDFTFRQNQGIILMVIIYKNVKQASENKYEKTVQKFLSLTNCFKIKVKQSQSYDTLALGSGHLFENLNLGSGLGCPMSVQNTSNSIRYL